MEGEGEKKQVRVTVLNQSFTLTTTGNPQEMVDLAQQVDDFMNALARRRPNLDSTSVAVYACLHIADQLRSREATLNSKVTQFNDLLEQAIAEPSPAEDR